MQDKTEADAKMRLSALQGLRPNLTLSLAAEEDAIKNSGVKGWNEFLRMKEKERFQKRVSR